jgi:GNAT superfamily N-acetyltransferase
VRYEPVETWTEGHVAEVWRLYRGEWWSKDRTEGDVRRVLAHSHPVFGLVEAGSERLSAFARVVTDRIFKAFVFDVIVDRAHRGSGLGQALMGRILAHPDVRSVRHVELYCLDGLVPFYEKLGFTSDVGGVRLLRRTVGGPAPRS